MKNYDFLEIYNNLDFLNDSLRLQYANFIYRHYNEKITLTEIIQRLKQDEPIEYILNIAEFYGLELYVDNRVLIPRIDTENLVTHTLKYIKNRNNTKFTIIDVGTGSGCIAIALAKNLDKKNIYQIIAIEKYREALAVAAINIKQMNLNNRIKLINSDFRDIDFAVYPNLVVCANLPYIPENRILPKSVKDFEPKTALFGGQKGDELIQALKKQLTGLHNLRFAIFELDGGQIEIFHAE